MDVKIVTKWLEKYPDLAKFADAGTISLKMARVILDVDRWFMYDIYKELLIAGAVTSSGNNSWRATPEFKDFLVNWRSDHKCVESE